MTSDLFSKAVVVVKVRAALCMVVLSEAATCSLAIGCGAVGLKKKKEGEILRQGGKH